MTETGFTGGAPDDGLGDAPEGHPTPGLITAVRGGDVDAYGVLFARHVDSARRLARSLSSDGEADDLVSEAFAKVLVVLQRGEGPDTALRPYLLTALRRLHVDRVRSVARTRPTDDMAAYDTGEAFQDTAVAGFENGAAARAFQSLPERWQLVLWHLEVEGQKPAEVAPLLGISANSVSALGYRAREGLRQAFVSMHAQDADDERCATTRAHLGAFIRNDISKRDGAAVEAHLRDCRECAGIYLELVEVNSGLRALLAPIVLGGAAAAYLAGTGTGAVVGAGGAGLVGTITGFVADNLAKSVAAAAAAGVAVAGVVVGVTAVSGGGGHEPRDSARESTVSASADPSAGPTRGDGTSRTPGQPRPSGGPTPTKPALAVPDVVVEGTPDDVGTEQPETDGDGSTRPTQPSERRPPTEPSEPSEPSDPEPTPTETAEPDESISTSATGTGGLAWVVDVGAKGLEAGERGTITVTLDRPALGIHLDPRCDLISLGRLTCRVTGPGTVRLLVTPLPGAASTLTAVLRPGDDRSSVRLG